MFKKMVMVIAAVFIISSILDPTAYSQAAKLGYVDLRKTFYEYDKTKNLETKLNQLTEDRQASRTKMIGAITKARDEAELLSGAARKKKQTSIEKQLGDLQKYDRDTRQQLLNQKNDMFRQVIDDIQGVVRTIGEKDKYDYVLDSRNIMYAKPEFDLTDRVIKELNQK